MKNKPNSGASPKEMKDGYKDGMYKPDEHELDESPPNSNWRDLDDGGFLGRPKGGER